MRETHLWREENERKKKENERKLSGVSDLRSGKSDNVSPQIPTELSCGMPGSHLCVDTHTHVFIAWQTACCGELKSFFWKTSLFITTEAVFATCWRPKSHKRLLDRGGSLGRPFTKEQKTTTKKKKVKTQNFPATLTPAHLCSWHRSRGNEAFFSS